MQTYRIITYSKILEAFECHKKNGQEVAYIKIPIGIDETQKSYEGKNIKFEKLIPYTFLATEFEIIGETREEIENV